MTTLTYKNGVLERKKDGEYLVIGSGTGKDVVRSIGRHDLIKAQCSNQSAEELIETCKKEGLKW